MPNFSKLAELIKDLKPAEEAGKAALDMSHEARMARANQMGFDPNTQWFHGTAAPNIEAFDPNKVGEGFKEANNTGFWFTQDPEAASSFASSEGAKNIDPNILKQLHDNHLAEYDKYPGDSIKDKLMREKLFNKQNSEIEKVSSTGGANIIPTHLKMSNPMIADMNELDKRGIADDPYDWNKLIEQAKANGHDGVVFKNTQNRVGWIDKNTPKSNVAVVFDPSQIRSVNAKFDPDMSGSGNILASYGLPLAGAGILASQKQSLANDLQHPVASGMSEVGSQLSNAMDQLDRYTGQPLRAGATAALQGQNPLTAAYNAYGSDKKTTGEDVAKAFLAHSPQLGFPTPEGGKEFPLQKPIGMAADMALDPTQYTGLGEAADAEKFGNILKLLGK